MAETSLPANLASTLTTVLKVVGGILVSRGVITGNQLTDVIGGLLVVITLGYSYYQNHKLLHSPAPFPKP